LQQRLGPLIIPKIQNNAKLQMSDCSKAQNPSPINLSQSTAQPCDSLCDLVMDDAYATNGYVAIESEKFLVLSSQTNLGTCKFNGEGYSCYALVVTHPSSHTIENIQADAEVQALFRNPTGKNLTISSLIRVNPAETQSTSFLNKFIPYAVTGQRTEVTLNNWSLSMMVPPNATFYSYQGTNLVCNPSQVIVFGSMINIDSNAFALLVKKAKRTSVGVQPLGSRQVYFNNGQQLPGPQMPNDGKIYMRIRSNKADDDKKKGSKFVKPVSRADVSSVQTNERNNSGIMGSIFNWTRTQAAYNGWFALLNVLLMMIAIGLAIYAAYAYNDQVAVLLTLNDKARNFAMWMRGSVVSGVSNISLPSLNLKTSSASTPASSSPSLTKSTGSRNLI
jgi:carbonic anhydrase